MLHVVVLGDHLDSLKGHIEGCRNLYSFNPSYLPLSGGIKVDRDPVLAFIEAPVEDRGKDSSKLWVLLRQLQEDSKKSLVRAYVVSTGEDFDSIEVQKAWMEHTIVVGYDLQSHLNQEIVRSVIGEMITMAAVDGDFDGELRSVGSILKMPEGEYAHHRFVGLFIVRMPEVMVSVRQVAEEMKNHNPPPHRDRRLRHPFTDRPFQGIFDEAVEAVCGTGDRLSKSKERHELPESLRNLRKDRPEGYIAPHLLLLGETGTGKTHLAHWLHRLRFEGLARSEEDWRMVDFIFQDLNCGGISPNLIDSELFGGVAGAWTDLSRNTPGKIFCACHGTLFLDEISEMPLHTQTVLLKFLDNGEYQPVGWHGEKLYIPVTIIAATNQPVEKLVAEGRFRRDLYERFRFRVRMPSLRERIDDLDQFVDFVLQNPQTNRLIGKGRRTVNSVSLRSLDRLRGYSWPGNFRELEQVLWQAVFRAAHEGRDVLLPHHIVFPSDLV